MNAPSRLLLAVAVVLASIIGFFGLRFGWDPSALRKYIQAQRVWERLEQYQQFTFGHHEARERVVRDVIAQRCNLTDALERMEELDREWLRTLERDWPDTAIGIAEVYRQEWSDADYYYLRITELAADLLRDRPEEAASLLRRLEKEYQQLRASQKPTSTERPRPSR